MKISEKQKYIDSAIISSSDWARKNFQKDKKKTAQADDFLFYKDRFNQIESSFVKKKKEVVYNEQSVYFMRQRKNSSTLFSKYGRTNNFSTNNLELHLIKSDQKPNFSSVDGFLNFEKKVPVRYAVENWDHLYAEIKEKYGSYGNYAKEAIVRPFEGMSTVKLWNVSIVGSLVVGMFLMTFIYRYLGQGAAAVSISSGSEVTTQDVSDIQEAAQVLGASAETIYDSKDATQVENYVAQIMQDYQEKSSTNKQLEDEIAEMTKGYPIEKMAPYIAQQDRMVAAFMVGIAKQESSWGVHVPVDSEGNDCYNYWGYRGKRAKMGTGGHTCFDSRQDAVETVAKRLQFLVSQEKMTTPGKMVVVWKCGYDCSWDKKENVLRWVDSVNYYFNKFDDNN